MGCGGRVILRKLRSFTRMCERTTVSYNTMISGLCLNGKLDEAHVLFDQMTEKGLCKKGKIPEGIYILDQLLKEGLQPSTASYTVLIENFCEARNVGETQAFRKDMVDRGGVLAVSAYDSMILGLSEQGNVA
ncbi:Pentatricopeptide repeat-containing protein [Forsythia ovata]|uniref:Pentatricopeptide repeat-containing protein n=1 Tax=Forsythia ovata TaxID=205694 RepID=A0ABD1VN54_9LAMI